MSTAHTRSGRRTTAVVVAVAAAGLALVGCGESSTDPGSAGSLPASPTSPSTQTSEPAPADAITEAMLLTADELNQVGRGWHETGTGRTDDGDFLRCQRERLAELGATEVLVRTFERPAAGSGPATQAGHLIAYFPSEALLSSANQAVNAWLRTCEDHATGANGEPHWVKGGLAVGTVHRRGPEGPGVGEAWGLTFDDDPNDEYGWFESVGFGVMDKPYLTIVTYTDWGQDANYDLEQLPGVVLLQDAFAKLPV